MAPSRWIGIGALLAAIGVACGAFGAHALRDTLEATDQLDNWRTAVRYQVWHAIALIGFGILRERNPGSSVAGWCLLGGTVLFSGSIYLLALEIGSSVVWPLTPLGGVLLVFAWVAIAVEFLRRRD